jgi:hypothetical protein
MTDPETIEDLQRMRLKTAGDFWLPQWPPNTQPRFTYGRPTFEAHVGESGKTWLVPAITVFPNRADHIYVTAYADVNKYGQGFAGRTLDMPLISGRSFMLRGGWHSRAEALLEDTGIDTTRERKTYGAVGLHRGYGGMEIVGVLYKDESPQIGYHERIVHIAQKFANEYDWPIFYSFLSAGGGASAQVNPEGR